FPAPLSKFELNALCRSFAFLLCQNDYIPRWRNCCKQKGNYYITMLGFLGKIFGSKYERDIKQILPIVEQIKVEYAKLQDISHDELRKKTVQFKARIKEALAEIDKEIGELKTKAESADLPIQEKPAV